MKFRIRRLRVRIGTERGLVGVDVDFPDGCVVLRSGNTAGKSSVLNSIIYGLGLEGMLGPSHDVPLPHAYTDWVEVDGESHRVLESRILLEIEGEGDRQLTVERVVVGNENRNLIKTWSDHVISDQAATARRTDYFVRQPGSARRGRGFHAFLESFIGWQLPSVPRYQSDPEKLYMEAIWPLLYVEQKQGWSVIEGRFPTYLGIKQMSNRAIEFVLRLGAYDIATERAAVSAGELRLRDQWEGLRRETDRIASQVNGVTESLPTTPTGDWPPEVAPRILIPHQDSWLSLADDRSRLTAELRKLQEQEIPRVESVIHGTEAELAKSEAELTQLEHQHDLRQAALESERTQLDSLLEKIDSTQNDLQKHRDLAKLREMGSDEALEVGDGTCPTCHQALADNLMVLDDQTVLGLEENVAFLNDQLSAFEFMKGSAGRAVMARERSLSAGIREMEGLRSRIRQLKQTLVSDGRLPSRAVLHESLSIERRLEEMESVDAQFSRQMNAFAQAAEEWRELQASRSRLPSGELSAADRQKLDAFREVFVGHVARFGLRSLSPESLELSLDTYRPTHAGVDLQFDLSASDTIRTIWAYRMALLQLSSSFETCHPGLLIFDEPGQHEMSSDSLLEFLRTCQEVSVGHQIIIATSGDLDTVGEALDGTTAMVKTYEGFVLGWV